MTNTSYVLWLKLFALYCSLADNDVNFGHMMSDSCGTHCSLYGSEVEQDCHGKGANRDFYQEPQKRQFLSYDLRSSACVGENGKVAGVCTADGRRSHGTGSVGKVEETSRLHLVLQGCVRLPAVGVCHSLAMGCLAHARCVFLHKPAVLYACRMSHHFKILYYTQGLDFCKGVSIATFQMYLTALTWLHSSSVNYVDSIVYEWETGVHPDDEEMIGDNKPCK